MNFYEPQTLIVVYRDELHVNQLKKLVETKDDCDSETTVGTKDGSVQIVAWTEKVWLEQKKAGNINNKVLFLGGIKGTDKLIPVVDIVFDKYGVKYGWAGNQAIIWIEPKALDDEESYKAFLEQLRALPVPKSLKSGLTETCGVPVKSAPGKNGFWTALAALGTNIALATKDAFSNKKLVKQQMLFFGIINLYTNDLERFMQA